MKRILLVGLCYADAQSLKKAILSKFNVEIIDTTKVEESKNILRQKKINAAFISRILAGDKSSGLDFLNYLRKNYPEIPIIMLTRFPEAQKQAIESGASAAFDIDLLIGYIRPSMVEKKQNALTALQKILAD